MIQETYLDLENLVRFLDEARKFKPSHDDKLQKLIRLLKSKELVDQKVLIFTEFADTARYLFAQLRAAGIVGAAQIDSGSKANRADVIRRFSPYYNGSSSSDLEADGESETRVLISTDVLSEGLNLQDASRMINYDIHWNPVRLMQRIGRVDRRMSPEIEEHLVEDHPEVATSRGKVQFWNFLPPDELNAILTLYAKVSQKTMLISKTLGIEGKKLLTPKDDYDALKDFNHAYEGEKSVVEAMHLEYQSLLAADRSLETRLKGLPGASFSGRERAPNAMRGVFFCFSLPALDKEIGEFTEKAGLTRWYFIDFDRDEVLDEPHEMLMSIRSTPETARVCTYEQKKLVDVKARVEKHIKDTYLRKVDAPIGVRPSLKCWMELNEG
jgi:superfamily II DNA/RNA helicase